MTTPDRPVPRFELRVLFRADTLAGWEAARPVLEALLAAGAPLAPTVWDEAEGKHRPLTPGAIERKLSGKKPPRELFFFNEADAGWQWRGIHPKKDPGSKLVARVPLALVAGEAAGERVVALAAALCRAARPAYGWAHPEEDLALADDPKRVDAWAPREVVEAYWLTILGPEMVKALGRARVASTPAHRVEFLDDGTALVVLTPDPSGVLSPEGRRAQAAALAHLRPGRTAEEILPGLLERSERLQPAGAGAGDPDLEELYRVLAGSAAVAERRAREEALRARTIAPVDEWRPAAEALPSDVDDPAAAAAALERQGETFVMGKHAEIPKLAGGDPESLPYVDAHFHLRDYLKHNDAATLERLMVPTLGAHLGSLLVRFLDGEWVPRRTLEESQVIVGDRAWLPFARVRRFLGSKDAAIDYSLTKFYREAERHAGMGPESPESPES